MQQQGIALKEIRAATEELSEMADELRGGAGSAKAADNLSSAAEELSATVQQCNSAARQIMQAVQEISKASESQRQDATESENLTVRCEKVMDAIESSSQESQTKVTDIQTRLSANKVNVDEMIEKITGVVDQSSKSAENIKFLGERARRIDKTLDGITTVNIKIDLLALNGAIEAARAGKYGKGFVVVAGDVKELAQEAAKSADQVKEQVAKIQAQISLVAGEIEKAGEDAAAEVERAKKSTTALVTIADDIGLVLKGVQQIAKGAVNAKQSLADSRDGAVKIKHGAELASNSAQEASQAASQQASAMQQLTKAIEEIARMSEEMKNG